MASLTLPFGAQILITVCTKKGIKNDGNDSAHVYLCLDYARDC